jgi:hypothetical protein
LGLLLNSVVLLLHQAILPDQGAPSVHAWSSISYQFKSNGGRRRKGKKRASEDLGLTTPSLNLGNNALISRKWVVAADQQTKWELGVQNACSRVIVISLEWKRKSAKEARVTVWRHSLRASEMRGSYGRMRSVGGKRLAFGKEEKVSGRIEGREYGEGGTTGRRGGKRSKNAPLGSLIDFFNALNTTAASSQMSMRSIGLTLAPANDRTAERSNPPSSTRYRRKSSQ